MDYDIRLFVQTEIAKRPTGEIENFFGSRGLLGPWNRDGKNWGRAHRVAQTLEVAEERGDLDETLMAAVKHFEIGLPQQTAKAGQPSDPERRVRQMAFDAWVQTGEWPFIEDLQHDAEARGEYLEVDEVVRRLEQRRASRDHSRDGRSVLNLRVGGFVDLDGAKPYLDALVEIVRLLYRTYRDGGPNARVTDEDFRQVLGFDDDMIARMYPIADREGLFGGGGSSEQSFNHEPSSSIRKFRDVKDIDGFLAVSAELFKPYVPGPPLRLPASPQQQLFAPVSSIDPLTSQPHPKVAEVAGELFAAGHYGEAVFAAFKSLEVRLAEQSGSTKLGQDLVTDAFHPEHPKVALSPTSARMAKDEFEGFRFLFMGAMRLRNLGAHDFPVLDDRLAAHYLSFVSLLFDRLDAAAELRTRRRSRPKTTQTARTKG